MFCKLCKGKKIDRNLLNGEWVESTSKNGIKSRAHLDNSIIDSIQSMAMEEADQAIQNTK